MQYKFFALISRMRYIARWGLMRNTFQENIQEHSHMVAVLAHALALIERDILGGSADPDRCATAALFHDASEILTGDLPTPVKYKTGQMQEAYRCLEESATQQLMEMLPPELREDYRPLLMPDTDTPEYRLMKAADKLSAHIKCIEELKAGNNEFRQAAAQTAAAMDAMRLPELDYFREHFLPSYSLTLDELE